jgi:hypothetical protein
MDDASGERYPMFFVEEEGIASSLKGVQEAIENGDCLPHFIQTVAAITGTHLKQAARRTRTILLSLDKL